MAEIKILKLTSGHELIVKILDKDLQQDGWIECEDAFLINAAGDEKGNVRVNLLPFTFFSGEKKVLLNIMGVLSIFSPIKGIEDMYRQQTSGIVLANQNALKELEKINENSSITS